MCCCSSRAFATMLLHKPQIFRTGLRFVMKGWLLMAVMLWDAGVCVCVCVRACVCARVCVCVCICVHAYTLLHSHTHAHSHLLLQQQQHTRAFTPATAAAQSCWSCSNNCTPYPPPYTPCSRWRWNKRCPVLQVCCCCCCWWWCCRRRHHHHHHHHHHNHHNL